jgi:hypothetical protein
LGESGCKRAWCRVDSEDDLPSIEFLTLAMLLRWPVAIGEGDGVREFREFNVSIATSTRREAMQGADLKRVELNSRS